MIITKIVPAGAPWADDALNPQIFTDYVLKKLDHGDLGDFDHNYTDALLRLTGPYKDAFPDVKYHGGNTDPVTGFKLDVLDRLKDRLQSFLDGVPAEQTEYDPVIPKRPINTPQKIIHILRSIERVDPDYKVSLALHAQIREHFMLDVEHHSSFFAAGMVQGYMRLSGVCGMDLNDEDLKQHVAGTIMANLEKELGRGGHHHLAYHIPNIERAFASLNVPFTDMHRDHITLWLHEALDAGLRNPGIENGRALAENIGHVLERLGSGWLPHAQETVANRALTTINSSFRNAHDNNDDALSIGRKSLEALNTMGVSKRTRDIFGIAVKCATEAAKFR